MPITLNLHKAVPALKLVLEKRGILKMPNVEMCAIVDVSGSFEDEHLDGTTTDLLTRLAPWGLSFDPDRQLDVFSFANGPGSAHHVGALNEANYQGFVQRQIVRKVPGWNGGTDYSYVLEAMLQHYGWMPKPAGLLGALFGRKPAAGPQRRTLAVFITDGDNTDKDRTREVLTRSQARGDEVYFLFLGVSNQGGGRFPFLESIGDDFGNTGFKRVDNVRAFVQQSDEQINDYLIDPELGGWLGRTV